MSDHLLDYYNRELQFIRRMAAEFAAANPRVAGHLRIDAERVEDPHVARLIEAFALLAARVRRKLDDDFPEITDALLGILYPHYLAPVPSSAIVQFNPDPTQGKLTEKLVLERGAELKTVPDQNQPVACQFRTCYPVDVWPIQVSAASLRTAPFKAPQTRRSPQAAAVLEIELTCLDKDVTFSQLPVDRLRFFLNQQAPFVYQLYELLMNNVMEVAVAGSGDQGHVVLEPSSIRPVGFELDEGLLPYPPSSFLGYRLLTEFFVFPEKFLFFDLSGLSGGALQRVGRTLHLYFYLNRPPGDLIHNISQHSFQLGCAPMVNLFPMRAEPIPLTQTEYEYHVKMSERRPEAYEIYSVDRVVASAPGGETVEYQPFYSVQHSAPMAEKRAYWYASRRPSNLPGGGTEVGLSLVNLDFQPEAHADWTLDVEATCLNRGLPHQLPFGGGKPRLQATVARPVEIRCLTRPTPTLRPALRQDARWRVISHLALNHLSLSSTADGAAALREMLKLYDFSDSPETASTIDGIDTVEHRRVVKRVRQGGASAVCRGTEILLDFDEDRATAGSVYLFASVLERFFALYSSINSFTTLVARSKQREGIIRKWSPRAGDKVLV